MSCVEEKHLGLVVRGTCYEFSKENLLRLLLTRLKSDSHDHHFIYFCIFKLREQGIDFPEFRAIEKSLGRGRAEDVNFIDYEPPFSSISDFPVVFFSDDTCRYLESFGWVRIP